MAAAARTRSVAALLTALLGPGAGVVGVLALRSSVTRWGELHRATGPGPRPDELLAVVAAAAAGLLLCWIASGLTLAVAGHLCRWDRGVRTAGRLLPRVLRGAVATALSGSLVLGAAGGALADGTPPTPGVTATVEPPRSAAVDPASVLPDPGWTPPPPPLPAVPSAPVGLVSAAGRSGPVEDQVVVRRGDSLWAIAARHLGAGASPAQIAREWPRWYAANRTVIGPDPDRLEPGQRLAPPRRLSGPSAPQIRSAR